MNMAIDEALLSAAAKRGRPLLRIYLWQKPSVSFGYFQKFPAHVAGQHDIVRRPTGGGLVYHGDGVDTTYTVVVPSDQRLHKMSAADAYSTIHKAVAAALEHQPALYAASVPSPRGQYECFQEPVAGDVVADGRKLAGGAQRRNKRGMLHQGSIAVRLDAGQLAQGFSTELGVRFEPYSLTDEEGLLAERLTREKYATDVWNRRIY